ALYSPGAIHDAWRFSPGALHGGFILQQATPPVRAHCRCQATDLCFTTALATSGSGSTDLEELDADGPGRRRSSSRSACRALSRGALKRLTRPKTITRSQRQKLG